jgi:hypothetical protein
MMLPEEEKKIRPPEKPSFHEWQDEMDEGSTSSARSSPSDGPISTMEKSVMPHPPTSTPCVIKKTG